MNLVSFTLSCSLPGSSTTKSWCLSSPLVFIQKSQETFMQQGHSTRKSQISRYPGVCNYTATHINTKDGCTAADPEGVATDNVA